MNSLRTMAAAFIKSLIVLALVLNLTSCSEKAVSQEPSGSLPKSPPVALATKQISEVAPPEVIQELRQTLEVYRPQVSIVTPNSDEILQDNTATIRFQVKDLPIFKDPQLDMGPHLHVILDNQPYIAVYDLNQPLVLSDLSVGTHTLRVFASRPWHESFKNEGAYAQTTFHIFTKSDDNKPDPTLPLLTYSRPKGSYGAEPILLDFYLTNAPVHLVATDNPDNQFTDWRIRCTINGESFILDRWQAVYLKGFKPGKNWVKLEFLDNQGNPVKNEFNSTARLITYEPKGKDTLSKIVRGELLADQVRAIVDPNYAAKAPTTEAKPTPTTPEKQPVPEAEPKPSPNVSPTVESTPETQPEVTPKPEATEVPEKSKTGGFFQRPTDKTTAQPSPNISPSQPGIIETIAPAPKPEATEVPEKQTTQSDKSDLSRYFKRNAAKEATPEPSVEVSPSVPQTLPEIVIESPKSEAQQEIIPKVDSKSLPQKIAPEPDKPELERYFSPNQYPNAAPSPTLPYSKLEMEKAPVPEEQPTIKTQE